MNLYGNGIRLSKVSAADLDFICRVECDPSLWYFEEHVQWDENEVKLNFLEKMEQRDPISAYDFVVFLEEKERSTPIGLAQIWSYNDYRRSWEIGFAILPEFSGRGYGSEAGTLLLKFAFEKLHAHKVVGMCNAGNRRSASLMERIGMTREAVFREELWWQERWSDQYFFSILDNEFQSSNGKRTE
ncbi:GNAT family N-acetyltransferase [Paenibacillus sp. GCM10027627]|uniref:GNAT family N-acetyltransferase n=1 Tax=unclassified Paenibacillus TaxID=185978 RepID=UPI00362CE557